MNYLNCIFQQNDQTSIVLTLNYKIYFCLEANKISQHLWLNTLTSLVTKWSSQKLELSFYSSRTNYKFSLFSLIIVWAKNLAQLLFFRLIICLCLKTIFSSLTTSIPSLWLFIKLITSDSNIFSFIPKSFQNFLTLPSSNLFPNYPILSSHSILFSIILYTNPTPFSQGLPPKDTRNSFSKPYCISQL